ETPESGELLVAVVAARAALAVPALGPAIANRCGPLVGGRRVGGRLGIDLEDPEAQDAVSDLQAVVPALEPLGLALEADDRVVGLVPLADLVGELPHPPGVGAVERARALDLLAHVAGDLLARVIRGLGVEHQDDLVVPVHSDARL